MNKIEIENITKTYGETTALKNISLSITEGSVYGLLGTNGAGKSTLFKLLVRHIYPDSGKIRINGEDIQKGGYRIRQIVGYLPELADFPKLLTAKEVLNFHAKLRDIDKKERDEKIQRILATVGLRENSDRQTKEYSKGMKRRLGLATSLIGDVDVLLLDEPTAGLDPLGVNDFHDIIIKLRDKTDLTVLLSSHILTDVERLCNEITILHQGKIKKKGSISQLKKIMNNNVTLNIGLETSEEVKKILEFLDGEAEIERQEGTFIRARCSRYKAKELFTTIPIEPEVFEVYEPSLNDIFEKAVKNDKI